MPKEKRGQSPFITKMENLVAAGRSDYGSPRHALKFPSVHEKPGPPIADNRQATVLLELANFVRLARIPRGKANATADLLVRALTHQHQWLWDRVMTGLASMSAEGGWYNDRVSNVLVSEQNAKARMESLARLDKMGPQPKEPEGEAQPS